MDTPISTPRFVSLMMAIRVLALSGGRNEGYKNAGSTIIVPLVISPLQGLPSSTIYLKLGIFLPRSCYNLRPCAI